MRDLTQVEAAREIGVSYKALQDHEAGRWPNRANQEKYVTFYGCDWEWFLTGKGEAYPGGKQPHMKKSGKEVDKVSAHSIEETFDYPRTFSKEALHKWPALKALVVAANDLNSLLVRAILEQIHNELTESLTNEKKPGAADREQAKNGD